MFLHFAIFLFPSFGNISHCFYSVSGIFGLHCLISVTFLSAVVVVYCKKTSLML